MGRNRANGLANYALTGIVSGDIVAINRTVGAYFDKNVGTGKVVTVDGLTLSGAVSWP